VEGFGPRGVDEKGAGEGEGRVEAGIEVFAEVMVIFEWTA
jgi:hypothetical protein